MTGNKPGFVPQPTHLRLLTVLTILKVVDGLQAGIIAGWRSVTRRNAHLLNLVRAGLVNRFFVGTTNGGMKALYTLSKKGAAFIGVSFHPLQRAKDSVLVGDLFVQHQLAINEVYIQAHCSTANNPGSECIRWMNLQNSVFAPIPLRPDAYFELKAQSEINPLFLEVDRGSETQRVWDKKTQMYLQVAITGEFKRLFGREQFRVLVVTESNRRMEQIRRTVSQQTHKVFYFSTLENIKRDGLDGAHWLRPVGDQRSSLVRQI